MKLRSLSVALSLALLTGCSSLLAPDYQRPEAPVPASLPDYGQTTTAQRVDLDWQTFIQDERLRKVVAQALANNRDLRIAALNIDKARAQYGITRANLLPAVSATAAGSHSQTAQDLTGSGSPRITHSYNAGVGFSAWEIDLFGKLQNQTDAARETVLQSVETRNATQLSLIAEVVNGWLSMAADQDRLKLAEETLRSRRQSLDLIQRRFALGIGSQLDVSQAQGLMESARVDAASYRSQLEQDRNALTLLVGAPLDEATLPPAGRFDGPPLLAELPSGLSSGVLLSRPDLRADEHALKAANANIGAARAAFFPSITLTASAGSASNDMSRLFEGGNGTWSFLPQLNLPIFNAGALSASLDVAKVSRDINVAQYQKDIQTAFREAADALAVRASMAEQLAAQQRYTDSAVQTARLTDARYRAGIDGSLNQLDAQRSLYAAQQQLIGVKLARESNRITLYKVLGGGANPSPN
ncbi:MULTISPECIES: efflux transporter outer membrane subunit [unclassified Paludibacterium]|uniref:efflux transporter outer membrane subunit n=1 Tax=unclassified Paludibacterium TaxID=2618429 RepID=UPI001C0486E4|nr:efflux transporter outer membrane subunit [Paludibacterium sp. B53371]BEV71669.1 efflux transporter outer membrane subunit [Paludibacterium sp. THUN1379]